MRQILSASDIDSLLLDWTIPLPVTGFNIILNINKQKLQSKHGCYHNPSVRAGYNHVIDYIVLGPVLPPISQCPRKWCHSWPSQQLPLHAAQAPNEQRDFLTENGMTFLVPTRLCTEEACLPAACVVAKRTFSWIPGQSHAHFTYLLKNTLMKGSEANFQTGLIWKLWGWEQVNKTNKTKHATPFCVEQRFVLCATS